MRSSGRVVVVAVLDIAVWAIVYALLAQNDDRVRAKFWYRATWAARLTAQGAGRAAVQCEARYWAAVSA